MPYIHGICNKDNSTICQSSGTSLPSTPRGVDNDHFIYGLVHDDKHLIPQGSKEYSFKYTNPVQAKSTSSYTQKQNQVFFFKINDDL